VRARLGRLRLRLGRCPDTDYLIVETDVSDDGRRFSRGTAAAPPEEGGQGSDAHIPLPTTKRQRPGSPPASSGATEPGDDPGGRGRGRLNLLWLLQQPRERGRGRDGGGGVERRGARPRPAAARGRAPRAIAGPARRLGVLSLPLPHRWPPRRGLPARATWWHRPRCGASTGLPLLLASPTYLVGAREFGSRPRPATRRTTILATT
jgi:hypothetical protein